MKKAADSRFSGVMKRPKNSVTKGIAAKGEHYSMGNRVYSQCKTTGQVVRVA